MINLDCKIQIRYIDTKYELADHLTKGNFTRDEWNNLLRLFNISQFSFFFAALRIPVYKLLQNDGEEDAGKEGRRKNCGKIEIYSDEPVFPCSGKFLIRKKSDCIQKSGFSHRYGET